jgi:2-keto-4-pentenoate hydratase/2-oxohepta-3-ene-1,7-dioic acid hydratase in catechol pathway
LVLSVTERLGASSPAGLTLVLFAVLAVLALGTSCAGPVVKPEALDERLLASLRDSGSLLRDPSIDEDVVQIDSDRWMRVSPDGPLTFAGLRAGEGRVDYSLVLECDPAEDALRLWPLAEGENPLQALGRVERREELERVRSHYRDGTRREGLVEESLSRLIDEKLFAPPLPTPDRIVATAANFRGHLVHDLDVDPGVIERFRETPARVFQKHPPLEAPGRDPRPEPPFTGVIGPFDTVIYPDVVVLPDDEKGVTHVVPTYLDYEVELGMVVAHDLTWEDVAMADDDELWKHVAGYVLVSDVKARNPQVFERILARGTVPTEREQRYLTGEPSIDEVIGRWDEETCDWWGYAASQGNYAALGPFFVAARGDQPFQPRAVACARTYAPERVRGAELPKGRRPDTFYLRQLSQVTLEPDSPGCLLWSPPAILRATLSPISALRYASDERVLHAGDVIALGTPGGIALTVNRGRMLRVLDKLLFWWDAIDWHDAFFERDRSKYLQEGDQVFLWGEGLGFQRSPVKRLKLPPLPKEVADPDVTEVQAEAEAEAEAEGLDEQVEEKQDAEQRPVPR